MLRSEGIFSETIFNNSRNFLETILIVQRFLETIVLE